MRFCEAQPNPNPNPNPNSKAKICGFVRLRLVPEEQRERPHPVFPELTGAALIRELHVYGQMIATKSDNNKRGTGKDGQTQHMGFGRQLMAAAELEARKRGFLKVAVISGVGTRNYYRKLGYEMEGEGEFMTKVLAPYSSWAWYILGLFFAVMFLVFWLGLQSFVMAAAGVVVTGARREL